MNDEDTVTVSLNAVLLKQLHELVQTAQVYANSGNYYAGFWELCELLGVEDET